MSQTYLHGYTAPENLRLQDQAGTLVDLLHADTAYPSGCHVLEAGCGVGAQTVTLARQSPQARFTSIDISAASLVQAQQQAKAAELGNVSFRQADIFALPFGPASFDHVFVCFVLEHLAQPIAALKLLKALIKPGGSITVIEGDHGSAYFHPASAAADAAIQCQVNLSAPPAATHCSGGRFIRCWYAPASAGYGCRRGWYTQMPAARPWSKASPARPSPR